MTIKVVNIIPQSNSGETEQDSEPNVAVNPANPLEIAASAFTPGDGTNAPIYVSADGGDTWDIKYIIPTPDIHDITLRFALNSNNLYSGIIADDASFEILRVNDLSG